MTENGSQISSNEFFTTAIWMLALTFRNGKFQGGHFAGLIPNIHIEFITIRKIRRPERLPVDVYLRLGSIYFVNTWQNSVILN